MIYDTAMLIAIFLLQNLESLHCPEREHDEETKSEVLILRKSCIQLLLTQVTHSKHIGEFKIKQLTSTDCVGRVCVCSLYLTKAELLVRETQAEFTDKQ